MTDWQSVSLLGIDVGFSAKNKTTGIAQYHFGQRLQLDCVRTGAEHREAVLSTGCRFDAIAIDGPLVSSSDEPPRTRACESILSRHPFGRYCKAAHSHHGTGLLLRRAATQVADGMTARLSRPDAPLVEAFPNAFLGVMLDGAAHANFPRPVPRGKKSDLFFARVQQDRGFDRLFDHLHWHDDALKHDIREWAKPATRIAHEYRAAIVCVLTAGCALAGQSETIGDAHGGFIHLPPKSLWADWAREAGSDMPT